MKRIWPIALIVASNILYHICAKEVPSDIDAFASLTVTYTVACVASLICYFALRRFTGSKSLPSEIRKAGWATYALGVVIVGLETGWIFAYSAGWQISSGYIVNTAIAAAALLVIGHFLYKEKADRNKLIGLALCLAGSILINLQ